MQKLHFIIREKNLSQKIDDKRKPKKNQFKNQSLKNILNSLKYKIYFFKNKSQESEKYNFTVLLIIQELLQFIYMHNYKYMLQNIRTRERCFKSISWNVFRTFRYITWIPLSV